MPQLQGIVERHLPSNWDYFMFKDDDDYVFKTLSSSSSEYGRVRDGLDGSFNVTSIVRVQNPYLWGCYQLKKEENQKRGYFQEMDLWHATHPTSAKSIGMQNFDWRRSMRAKFGQGVCFSPSTSYAHQWSSHNDALIRTKVLVGESSLGSWSTNIPSQGCDTAIGTFNGKTVYVKFADNEFYPEYIVYYN